MAERTQPVPADTEVAQVPPSRPRIGLGSGSTALWILVIDVLLIVLFGLLSDEHSFWNLASFQNLGLDSAEALILAVAISLLLGAGEFDISLGANLLLASVFGGQVATHLAGSGAGVAAIVSLIVCVVVGAIVGLVNGTVVTRLRVNSLIATLAMLGIATGVANIVTKGTDLGNVPASLQDDFGIRTIAAIPLPAFVALAIWAIAWVMLRTTRFGLRLVALGSSRGAAERSGMRVRRHLLVAFVIVGALAGIAGFIDLTRFATTNLAGHQNDALAALTAAVIGGTSLFGGHISMGGVLSGTLLAVVLQDGLVVIGLSAFYQLIAVGAVLIAAVYLDQRRRPGTLRLPGST